MRIPRYEKLEGIGRVRVYDAGPRFADRYTVLFEDVGDKPKPYGPRQGLALGDNVGPNGFCQWIEARPPETWGTGARHRRILFASMPEATQRAVLRVADEL